MEGSGEGVVAVIQGLQDAGLAVTMLSKRHCQRSAPRPLTLRNLSLSQLNSSAQTNNDHAIKSSIGAQALDDRYASTYQLAHCHATPTSSPVGRLEFPPQRARPSRAQGNFEMGSYNSRDVQYSFRSNGRWSSKGSVRHIRASCQTDPFVHSLRRYSSLVPARSMSVGLIDRLIKLAQTKNLLKSSKTSKSMRTFANRMPDTDPDKQSYKTKRIQTYTRTRQDEPKESSKDVDDDNLDGQKKSSSQSYIGRRSKRSKYSNDYRYDYLKANSGLYRKRCDRVTDVRYLDNISKFMREAMNTLSDDPKICPKIQSRYNQHRRDHHGDRRPSYVADGVGSQAADLPASRDSPKKEAISATCSKSCQPKKLKCCDLCHRPLPCNCLSKKIQTECGWPRTLSIPSLASKLCGISTEALRRQSCVCESRNQCVDCNIDEEYKKQIEKLLFNWLQQIPVYSNDTPEEKVVRHKMIMSLAETLKDIPLDSNFDENAKNEIVSCLNRLPMWLPGTESEQKSFKEQIAENLLRLQKDLAKNYLLTRAIKSWVDQIPLNYNNINKKELIEDIVNRLQPDIMNRPDDDEEYAKILKPKIAAILKGLPLNLGDNEMEYLINLAIINLLKLPKDDKVKEDIDETFEQLVLREVDNFLNEASTSLSPDEKEELRATLVEILLNNVDQIMADEPLEENFSGDETDIMIDKLFERIRESYFAGKSNDFQKSFNNEEHTVMKTSPISKMDGFFHDAALPKNIIQNKTKEPVNKTKESHEDGSKLNETSPKKVKSEKQSDKEDSHKAVISKIPKIKTEAKRPKHNFFDTSTEKIQPTKSIKPDPDQSILTSNVKEDEEKDKAHRLIEELLGPVKKQAVNKKENKYEMEGSAMDSESEHNYLSTTDEKKHPMKIHQLKQSQTRMIDGENKDLIDVFASDEAVQEPLKLEEKLDRPKKDRFYMESVREDNTNTRTREIKKDIDGILLRDGGIGIGSIGNASPKIPYRKIDQVKTEQAMRYDSRMTGPKNASRKFQDFENKRKILQVITETFDNNPVKIPGNRKNLIKNKILDNISLGNESADNDDISSKIKRVLTNETILHNDLIIYLANKITNQIKENNLLKITDRFGRRNQSAFGLQTKSDQKYFIYNGSKLSGDVTNEAIKRKYDNATFSNTLSPRVNLKSHLKHQIADLLHKYNVSFTKQNTEHAPRITMSSKINQTTEKYKFYNTSLVHPEENDIINTSMRFNSEEKINNILDIVDSWVNLLPSDCKESMVNDLVRDIMDGQRYLRLNPNVIKSARDASEYMTYQVSKYPNTKTQESGTQTAIKPNLKELMKKLKVAKSSSKDQKTDKDEEKQSQETVTPYTKPTIYDFIAKWFDKLPVDKKSLDKEYLQNLKHDSVYKLLQKICELYLNPDVFYDDSLYEEVLRDEIDIHLDRIKRHLKVDLSDLSSLTDELIEKIKEVRQKKIHELDGQAYKQQLRDAISRTMSNNIDISDEDNQASFDTLKDALAEAFINLNYSQGNDDLYKKLTKKINNEINKFCNDYLKRHPETPLSSKKLNEKLYTALKNVYLPGDESMRSEVEFVRIKDIVCDWVKDLPIADTSPLSQRQHNKNISILAKRLHDLEKAEDLEVDMAEEMKKEIKKCLKKIPLQRGQDLYMDRFAKDLIDMLRNTEFSRRFRTSSRLSAEVINNLPFGETQRPCPESCTQEIPSCSLSREDRDHLDRIRKRAQICKSKNSKKTCRDATLGTCVDKGSQHDFRAFGPMKSVPSVCPQGFQRSDNLTSPCLRRNPSSLIPSRSEKLICPGSSPVESYADLQPQVIIKEYYWDSPCSPLTPSKVPCDTQTSQECPYHQSPRGPQQHGSPQPMILDGSRIHNRSPQMLELDHITRRQKFDSQSSREPSSSRRKEWVTHLGSLEDTRDLNFRSKTVDNEWTSVRFPDDNDFYPPSPRALIISDEEYCPFQRERDKREERINCKCRERFISRVPRKKGKNFASDSWQSCDNSMNNNSKYCAKQCPHPSYLYFRH